MVDIITKLCRIIADFFIKEKIIDKDQRDIYEYGIELCISSIIGIVIVLIVGLVSCKLIECIVFYIVFCFMRLFCGGFHAKTHLLCKISFTFILCLVLLLDWLLYEIPNYYWVIMCFYCFIIVCSLAPIDNPNKRLSEEEKKKNKIISIIEILIWFALICLMYYFNINLYHIVALTLFFVATLMLLGKFTERGEDQ